MTAGIRLVGVLRHAAGIFLGGFLTAVLVGQEEMATVYQRGHILPPEFDAVSSMDGDHKHLLVCVVDCRSEPRVTCILESLGHCLAFAVPHLTCKQYSRPF